ncbi:radical SAM protein [Bradyrhizobium yuanmingense]|uniref:radical SAM protein n=1 Tax=Bradyrhizobium yuanmingense TaxID=108015 RepID=UPI000FE3CDDF|nr:radical SAM protein [Bradyrhizobium yuanmingense]TGN74452.1 radical SAM protein [Bradyrhizobium yuanmingense]
MRSRESAFEEARSSLRRLGIPASLPALHAAGIGINRAVLGGSHSVAIYPPIDSLTPLDSTTLVDKIAWSGETSLYVHVAFCETRCTFCHYTVDHYTGRAKTSVEDDTKVARYLTALHRELAFWGARLARAGTVVSSVYIGGGTPLVLDEPALHGLIRTIRNEYDLRPGAEFCIEGSPLTIAAPEGEHKLWSLKAQGVTRLSFGVQSFDDDVLKYAARGYKRDIPIRACAIAARIFENWNLDLIQGLYKGSTSEVWDNLEALAEIRPPHLTWYHGRFGDRPQGHWYRTEVKRAAFEDEFATLLGRMLIWQEMATLGYHQTDGNRFVRAREFTDPFKKIRTSASSDLLGVGAGAYSHVGVEVRKTGDRGYVFRNDPSIPTYVDAVLTGSVPIATGRCVDEEEVLAGSYSTGLRIGRIEDESLRSIRAAHPQVSRYYDALVNELNNAGALESYLEASGQPGLRLSSLGQLFEDEVLSLFFSPAVKSALTTKPTRERKLQLA